LNEGEIVYGMTLAVNTVKKRQNEISVPEFRSQGDFIINTNNGIQKKQNDFSKILEDQNKDNGTMLKFKALLLELSKLYGKFPRYMIEIMAENSGISSQEIPELIKTFKSQKILILLKDEDFYYKVYKAS
jgi:hypothetical protein